MISFRDYVSLTENYKELIPYVNKHNELMRQYRKVLHSTKKGENINYKELNRLQDLMDENGEKLRAHAKKLKDKS